MIKNLLRVIATVFFALAFTNNANATHLMGGSLSYVYLGIDSTNGYYRYQVTIDLYRLCDRGSSLLPFDMSLGVYEDDSLNPGGDKNLVIQSLLPLILQQGITPPSGGDSCSFAPNVCVEEGVYQNIISVPPNNSGYYFISDRCCRNNTIANLANPGNTGQAYFAYAPPPAIVNSSPTFAVVPVPYICNTDTVSVLNQAYDPDGDLLVYHFGTPFWGVSSNANPNPNPPVTYPYPIPTINYAANYSLTQPFGLTGYIAMDTATGLAQYYAPNQGFYVVAVEIEEYRNGVLIGISRRDIQVIVIPCPFNPAPTLSTTTLQTTYTINEGDTLCFNTTFTDVNGDSIYITHAGNIFNGSIVNPPATFVDSSGAGLATGQFCWITTCDQGGSVPYQFSVFAADDGCPPKLTNVVYTINVIDTYKPIGIIGPDTICSNTLTGLIYTVTDTTGYSNFSWAITNGSIVGPNNNDSVTVNLNGGGPSVISVSAANDNGCLSDTVSKQIEIGAIPAANAGPDKNFCGGGTASLGSPSVAGYVYSWAPATGLSSTTISQPLVTLPNTTNSNIIYTYVVTVSFNGCSNTDTVIVTVKPAPPLSAGPDVAICSGDTVTLGVLAGSGNTYTWTPPTGLSNDTVSNPVLTLTDTSGTPVTYQYEVTVLNVNGCSSTDTVLVTVNPVPTANAGTDAVLCSGTPWQLGTTAAAGTTYTWSPTTGLNNSTISDPVATLTNITLQNDTITYVLTATIGSCIDYDTVQIVVKPNPNANAGPDLLLCSGSTLQIGGSATTGYTYLWTPPLGLSDSTISDPLVTLYNTGGSVIFYTYTVTVTLNGCTSTDSVTITSSPVPVANAGADTTYCSGNSVIIGSATQPNYTYSWSPTTGLSSSNVSNPTVTFVNSTGNPVTVSYIVTTNLFGCIDTDTVNVTIKPSPVSNAGPDQLLCSGDTIQIGTSSTTGYTYSWSPSTGLSSTSVSDPTVIISNTGSTTVTYTYVVTTDLNGCITTDTVTITSSPVPTAIAGNDTVYCSGNTVVIGSTGLPNYNYVWNPATGLSSATVSNPTVTLVNTSGINDTVTYILTTNLFGCFDSDTVQVVVKPSPVSNAGPDLTACGDDTLTLGTNSTTGYTYNWSPSTGLSSTTISNPVLILNSVGGSTSTVTYIVTTDLNGCLTSDTVNITVNPLPAVSASANPNTICAGAAVTLTASGATTYGWAISTAPGVTISTDSVITVTPLTTTTFILTGTSAALCSNTTTVTVTVNPLPNVQIAAVSDTVCIGDTVTLTGTGASSYSWSILGGGSLGNSTSIQVSPTTPTTYVVVGTDGNLCVNSDTLTLYVKPGPTLASVAGTVSVCPGVTGVMYWVINSNPNSNYTWVVTNGTIVSGQNTDTIVVDWSVTPGIGTVQVIETTDQGCVSNPVVLSISINPLLTPVAPTGPTSFCDNNALGVLYSTLNTPGSTYQWYAQGGNIVGGNGSANVTVDWTATGPAVVALWYEETSFTNVDTCFGTSDTLYVTLNPAPVAGPVSGPSGICVNDSGSFSVPLTAGSSYNWTVSGGTLVSGNGTNTINATFNTTGNATITLIETNSFGCSDTISYPVTINGLPNANAGLDVSVCIGQGVQLNASGGTAYSWTPTTGLSNPSVSNPFANPTTATNYVVQVTDGNGCKNTDTVLVSVNALPVITVSAQNPAVCIGNSTQLNATGGSAFVWSPSATLSNSNVSNPVATPTQTTTYTVIVTDQNTCVDSSTITITVNPLPTINASGDTTVCEGTGATLTANGGVTYSWTPTTGLDNPTAQNPIASPQTQTTYTVTGTDANGCSNTATVTISLNINPKADFTINDGSATAVTCDGYSGTLDNNSIDALAYQWILPNGTTSTDENPQVQFFLAGNNTIILIAYNNFCTDTLAKDFASSAVSQLFENVPNVFTPNNDGLNDCFKLTDDNSNLDDCSNWEVFDRWGKKVFTSSASKPCWNGKKDGDGKDLSAGTYYLIVTVADKTYHGVIELIR